MARPERIGASQSTVSYRGLRDWIEQVDKLGELQKVSGAHWDREMGASHRCSPKAAKAKRRRSCSTKCPAIPKATARSTASSPRSNGSR